MISLTAMLTCTSTLCTLQVPVVFFSLLRKGTPDRDRSEAKLAEAFDFLAGQLRSVDRLPVSYVALDWHQLDKELGSEALVEAFWTQLSALLPPQVCIGPSCRMFHDVAGIWKVDLGQCCLSAMWTGTCLTRSWAVKHWLGRLDAAQWRCHLRCAWV
eukprot:GHRR01035015.1.p1 GENE.GHRR01035015.1~~GHRR01035015.1.p1  ORF type:complete len:157 (-),score=42.15 GHRR01035015.1:389-859(-)